MKERKAFVCPQSEITAFHRNVITTSGEEQIPVKSNITAATLNREGNGFGGSWDERLFG